MRSWLVEIVSEDWEDCTKFQPGSVTLMCVVCGVWCGVVGREMLTRSLHLNNWYLQSPHHTGHTQVTATADSAARHGRQTWLSPETTKATDWTVRTQDSLMINLCLSSRPATRHCQLAGVFIYHIWSELSNIAEKMSFLRPGNKWDKIKDLTGLNGLSNYSN